MWAPHSPTKTWALTPVGMAMLSRYLSGASNLCCISSVMPKEHSEKPSNKLTQLEGSLRSYRGPWKGQLLLVCRKCQKKIKHSGTKNNLVKLSKTLKKRARRLASGAEIDIVSVSCLGMCPKGGITVCTGQLLARHECLILRSQDDVDVLIKQCAAEQ
jgi:hypothetical protein